MSVRTDKVASLVQKELGRLMNELELPFLTTISKVEVSPDLKHAKVWITVFTEKEEDEIAVLKVLKSNLFDLQQSINKGFKMKNIPRIAFALDHSQQYTSHINRLLKETTDEQS